MTNLLTGYGGWEGMTLRTPWHRRIAQARSRLVAAYDPRLSVPDRSLGYRWDIVLDGPSATAFEEGER